MFRIFIFHAVLILSLSGIIHSSTVPEEATTEAQNITECGRMEWNNCISLIERHLSSESIEFKQLQHIKNTKSSQKAVAEEGYIELMQVLLQNGLPINNKYPLSNGTLLHAAVVRAQNDMVTFLLKQGANANIKDRFSRSPLYMAVKVNEPEIVVELLNYGADPNASDEKGKSPLHVAVYYNEINLLTLLLEHGAEVNFIDNDGDTALHNAAMFGHESIVEKLINHGADINLSDNVGDTPLHKAAKYNKAKIIKLLLGLGAEIKVVDAKNLLHNAVKSGNIGNINSLIYNGSDINDADNVGDTPLHVAAIYNDMDIVELLLKRGAKIDTFNKDRETPLIKAVRYGNNTDIVKLLIEHGANINIADNLKSTPLHVAAGLGKLDIVKILLDRGANINSTDSEGNTPLVLATQSNNVSVVKYLQAKKVEMKQ